MKKLFTSLLLLAVGVVFANAASTLKVAGTSIDLTKDGTYTIGSGTATFTKSSRTLKLTDISLTNSDIYGNELGTSASSRYIIELESDLTIRNTNTMGMRFDNSYVVIQGNGHLITIDNSAMTETGRPAIDAEESHLDIWNARLNINSGASKCFYGNSSKGELYFSRVFANLKGSPAAIYGFKSVTVDDCLLFTEGSKFVAGTGVTDANGTLLSELQIRPKLMVGTRILRTASSESTEGVGSWDKDSKTLTLGWSFTGTSGYPCIANYGVDGLVIKFDAARTLTSKNANCIELYKATKFTGSGKLTVNAGSAYTGIYPETAEAVITIDGCNFEINAGYGIDGTGASSTRTNLTINNSEISVTASKTAMARLKSAKLTGCCVNTAQTPVFFNSEEQGFTDISGEWTDKVVIGKPTTTYNVTVCGQPVTDLNQTNILVDGLTAGKMLFKDNTNVWYFEMNKVTLTNNSGQEAIKTWGASKKFVIRCDGGTSTINQAGNEALYGLNSSAPMRLEGDNKLVLNVTGSTSYSGIRLYKMGLEVDLKGLDIVSEGYGINGVNGDEDVKLARRSYNTQYNLQGQNGPLKAGTLTLDQMDFDASATAGCYFDNKKIYQNGSSNTVTTNVRFSPVTDTYGITIAGTPITNCNSLGVGSKYITKGGATAVTFDGSKTLTLTDATINYGDDDKVCGIKNSNVDGLTIKLVGTNVITNSQNGFNNNNLPINIEANTTITGDGSLSVESLPVMTANSANLTFKDAKSVTFASSLRSTNNASNSILTVDNSNVTVNKYVSFFKNVTWPNGKLLTPANGYYDTTERYIYDANGTKAQGVVFGDKNATAIDAVEFDNNAEVKTIYDAAGRETNTAKRGLNIIRMSDGSVRKVMVK